MMSPSVSHTPRLGSPHMRLGLATITQLLDSLGNPQRKLRCVHVAGTNGKGSTIAFIGQVLECAGYTVGYFTSPALRRPHEQIRISSHELPYSDYLHLAERVQAAIEGNVTDVARCAHDGEHHAGAMRCAHGDEHPALEPTEFEALTALALLYFAEMSCDVVLLEVGLGGRLDATNVIDAPEVAVMCPISYDHEAVLGRDLPDIAREKAGIIKSGSIVVSAPQHEQALEQIQQAARDAQDSLVVVRPDDIVPGPATKRGQHASLFEYQDLHIGLLGKHQLTNAATALAALKALATRGFAINEEHIRTGFDKTRWPGRLEIIQHSPLMLVDGAHNSDGARVLAEALQMLWPEYKAALVMGVLADKNYPAMIRALAPVTSRVFCIDVPSERSLPAATLADAWQAEGFDAQACLRISDALDLLDRERKPFELGCACGSLYFLGEVRKRYLVK